MATTPLKQFRVRFGQFEADLSAGKLFKRGIVVRLENEPFQVLAALLERPGDLVTREELYARLWPPGTYVDFDEGLNTAIRKLRYALRDSAKTPFLIETVPRKGYRFIAPLAVLPARAAMAPPSLANPDRNCHCLRLSGVRPPALAKDASPKRTSVFSSELWTR